MVFREDEMTRPGSEPLTYQAAGVDVAAGEAFVERIGPLARSTHGPEVVQHACRYAGLIRPGLTGLADPLIAATCDGVGTKVLVAKDHGKYEGLGQDLVAMNVNDLLPMGARPILFLDYLAAASIKGEPLVQVVQGIAKACREVGCALLGGETAEMPGVYREGDFDLAGFAVGIVDGRRLPSQTDLAAGDRVLALRSTGVHSNGLSLARKALLDRGGLWLADTPPGLGRPLGDELLEPTALYVRPVIELLDRFRFKAAAHVTGGGLIGRSRKLLPEGLRMVFDPASWTRPAIFDLIAGAGSVPWDEMGRTFNLGLGFLVVMAPEVAAEALAAGKGEWLAVGELVAGETGVDLGFARG